MTTRERGGSEVASWLRPFPGIPAEVEVQLEMWVMIVSVSVVSVVLVVSVVSVVCVILNKPVVVVKV